MRYEKHDSESPLDVPLSEAAKEVLDTLTTEEKGNIVKQSFLAAAGSIEAHDLYVFYLCKIFDLPPVDASQLLQHCFLSLDESSQNSILQHGYKIHLDIMKRAVQTKKNTWKRFYSPLENREAAIISVLDNLPRIIGNRAFHDIQENKELVGLFSSLPRDFTPSLDSVVVTTIREIAKDFGYYNNKNWFRAQQHNAESSSE